MPTYDYFCPSNGHLIETKHRMSESVETWAQLCEISGMEPGSTPLDAPVQKKISAVAFATPKVGEWKKGPAKLNANRTKPHTHGPGCGCGH